MYPRESLKSSDAIAIRQQAPDRLEDLEDRLEMARVKKRDGDKPSIPWGQATKELGLNDLRAAP